MVKLDLDEFWGEIPENLRERKRAGARPLLKNTGPAPAWSQNVDEIRGGLGGLRRHTFCHTKCAKLARMAMVGKSKPLKSNENLIKNFMASPRGLEPLFPA